MGPAEQVGSCFVYPAHAQRGGAEVTRHETRKFPIKSRPRLNSIRVPTSNLLFYSALLRVMCGILYRYET